VRRLSQAFKLKDPARNGGWTQQHNFSHYRRPRFLVLEAGRMVAWKPDSEACNLQILSPHSEKAKPARLISFAALTGFSRKNAAKRW
jgi:hypothetical protein